MNLLTHLWLADRSGTSAAGQLLGDMVKGRMERPRFGASVDYGIRLHRRIDSRCDAHPVHRDLRARFRPPLRRYAGIIVDIGFDHALARDWHSYTAESLRSFAARQARQVAREWPDNAPAATPEPAALRALLAGYERPAGIDRALRSVSRRLRRDNPLDRALPALIAENPAFTDGLPELLRALEGVVEAH